MTQAVFVFLLVALVGWTSILFDDMVDLIAGFIETKRNLIRRIKMKISNRARK